MSAVYPLAVLAAFKGGLALDSADVRAIAIDLADYTYSASHEFLSDVPGGARVATSATITGTGVAITSGEMRFSADAFNIAGVTGDEFEAVLFYIHDGGADAARRLLCLIDAGTGLPFTPSGGGITFTPHATGVFAVPTP